jgi:hypothetical protein
MAVSLHDQLDTLYDKFDHAERKWLNRFDDLDGHFDTALRNFTANLPKGSPASTGVQEVVDVGSNVVVAGLALSAGPAAVAVPIVLGLKKLASILDRGEIKAPEPDVLAIRKKFKDIKKSFKQTTEHIGDQILQLKSKAGGVAADETVIRKSIGTILLSPIWYPPESMVTSNPSLAQALELRMWFSYFSQLMKMPPAKLVMSGINFSPMWKHFKEIGWAPNGLKYMQLAVPGVGIVWGVKFGQGDAYDVLRKLNAFGEKNKEVKLQHKYPEEVERYIALTKTVDFFANGNELPSSNLGWTNVAF